MDTGQYKGEISIQDMMEVTCNALLLSDAAITATGGTALNMDNPGNGSSSGGSTNNTTRILSRSFFPFSSSTNNNNDPTANNSKLLKEDKGFTIKTSSRVYVFQAESCSEAASWVITLRKFITAKHIK